MNKLIDQIIKMSKSQDKMLKLSKNIVSTENKVKYLSENSRQLNEIILVDTLKDLTVEEKYKTVLDIANYYLQHIEDKIIELEESGQRNLVQ